MRKYTPVVVQAWRDLLDDSLAVRLQAADGSVIYVAEYGSATLARLHAKILAELMQPMASIEALRRALVAVTDRARRAAKKGRAK